MQVAEHLFACSLLSCITEVHRPITPTYSLANKRKTGNRYCYTCSSSIFLLRSSEVYPSSDLICCVDKKGIHIYYYTSSGGKTSKVMIHRFKLKPPRFQFNFRCICCDGLIYESFELKWHSTAHRKPSFVLVGLRMMT